MPVPTVAPVATAQADGPRTHTTPKAIACGAKTCELGAEVCCADAQGNGLRCARRPKEDTQNPCAENELEKMCDENADCGAGSLCCLGWACSGGCPPRYECEKSRCSAEVGEICLASGSCSEGFACHAEAGREQGSCFVKDRGADCGGKRCSGERPICRWSESNHSGTCVAADAETESEPVEGVARLACSSASDCGGYACGKMAESPFQSFHCGGWSLAGDRFWPMLCATVRDCPDHWGKAATGCAPPTEGEAPSHTRRCVYPE